MKEIFLAYINAKRDIKINGQNTKDTKVLLIVSVGFALLLITPLILGLLPFGFVALLVSWFIPKKKGVLPIKKENKEFEYLKNVFKTEDKK